MNRIELRPDFVTYGAEAMDVLIDGTYVALLLLMYREGSRLHGTLIADEEVLQCDEKQQQLESYIDRHTRHLSVALGVQERELLFIRGTYSRIVTSSERVDMIVDTDDNEQWDEISSEPGETNDEIDDFDVVDETLPPILAICPQHPDSLSTIQVILARDDGDTLLYDIYTEQGGSLPVGAATIHTEGEQLSGYIDFRVPGTGYVRQNIAKAVLRELATEQQFNALHLNMMFHDEIIDEALLYVED